MRGASTLRVLYLPLEFQTWRDARSWSYIASLGVEEGLNAAGVEVTTIPTSWANWGRQIVAGRSFDQVWVEAVHQGQLSETWWEWLAEQAPVRLGLLPESLEYTPEEWVINERFKTRKQDVERHFAYLTHVAAVDEHDVADVGARGLLPTLWWPQAVPQQFVVNEVGVPPNSFAFFGGTPYGKRQALLDREDLKGLMAMPYSPESETIFPDLFDAIHVAASHVGAGLKDFPASLEELLHVLRTVRRESFRAWLAGMRQGCAVVNLPHLVKGYASRVPEGMAAGRPVISWEIPDRPLTRALFEDGKEILLFDPDDPDALAAHVERILLDPPFGQRIAERARRKLLAFHTAEHRVKQILDWLENGRVPGFAQAPVAVGVAR